VTGPRSKEARSERKVGKTTVTQLQKIREETGRGLDFSKKCRPEQRKATGDGKHPFRSWGGKGNTGGGYCMRDHKNPNLRREVIKRQDRDSRKETGTGTGAVMPSTEKVSNGGGGEKNWYDEVQREWGLYF